MDRLRRRGRSLAWLGQSILSGLGLGSAVIGVAILLAHAPAAHADDTATSIIGNAEKDIGQGVGDLLKAEKTLTEVTYPFPDHTADRDEIQPLMTFIDFQYGQLAYLDTLSPSITGSDESNSAIIFTLDNYQVNVGELLNFDENLQADIASNSDIGVTTYDNYETLIEPVFSADDVGVSSVVNTTNLFGLFGP